MTLQIVLSVISFAISLGGFVKIVASKDDSKRTQLLVFITTLFLLSGVTLYQKYQHDSSVESVSRQIISEFGEGYRTSEEIYVALPLKDFQIANEALEDLVDSGKLGQKISDLRDDSGATHPVRLYYLK